MASINRLLVAADLSARSDRAVERAVLLAAETDARLTVLHVVDSSLPDRIADRQHDDAKILIRDHLASLPFAPRYPAEINIVFGQDFETIIRVSDELDAGLIILGTHRNESARPMFLGATVERVLKYGARPVLVVKTRAQNAYRRIMIGVDFSDHSRLAAEFAVKSLPDAEFFVVHAFDIPYKAFITGRESHEQFKEWHQEHMDELVQQVFGAAAKKNDGTALRYEPVMRQGSAHQVIREQIDRFKPDLLVVGTHGRTGIAHAILGSVAQDLISSQPCDVLAVKAAKN